MTARRALGALLAVVATSGAVLSFAALRDLALLCGFSPRLAWLLPVVVDAGAAAGTLVWLGGREPDPARRFARVLALVLLGSSVAANALSHGLAAYDARPVWWVVVLVSGVAPAVLGAVVHLAVLCGRDGRQMDIRAGGRVDERVDLAANEPARQEPPAVSPAMGDEPPADVVDVAPAPAAVAEPGDPPGQDRAARLIAMGAGRRVLARELGIREHEARALLEARKNGSGS